ncbi:aldolase/citrate lyase family protein [Campylobacter sp. MIT 21-1685]|uniref:HpcH/HpaI aldolase family protein n=1 Tax=unclassified Campylobacter TaxID=2593542 RepID=UPI00224AFDBA|nr:MULTISPECIES: aldolase/citrate lyase family protein [unclassified Campylobacter]MCX2682514.1 aldolase/citrate lyase family protein [Campylobacter sp. MIT 21-1684]MCX2750773.1 aldolase/citrate lyase family protein [Campylobacter sp. MIT 21-1682]MCX2806995.1 aldolase/citrate lyase family protein [Campylobacter sp. MIT 21-1685]
MNTIKNKWSNNSTTLNGWISLNNNFSAEVMAYAGFDTLTVDMQHGISEYSTLIPMLTSIQSTKTPVFARIPWLEAGVLMKTLDAGVDGIICPMINTAQDAQKLVEWSRYPPLGKRSFGPLRAKFLKKNYFENSNQEICVFAMIETKEAIANLDDILNVKGIDGVYIGPADLSSSFGITPKFDQENETILENISLILRKTKSHKKYAGIHNLSAFYAKRMARLGFDFVTLASDLIFMFEGAKNAIKEFRLN